MPYLAYILAGVVVAALVADYLAACKFFNESIVMHREELGHEFDGDETKLPPAWAKHMAEIRANAGWLKAQEYEHVSITSRDGLRLTGYWLPAKGAVRTAALFHGYKSSPWMDGSGMGRWLHEHGCNLFFADQRAHGQSEGKYICFGVRERLDCVDWMEFLNEKYGAELPIYLFGVSMGATTVLMAAGERLPKNVRCVVGDCGFTSPHDEFVHMLRDNMHIAPAFVLPMAELICRARAGFGFSECSTLEALAHTELPVLLIHGGADNYVPTQMSRDACAACRSEKKLMIVEGAPHALSYYFEPENYRAAVEAMFLEHDEDMKTENFCAAGAKS